MTDQEIVQAWDEQRKYHGGEPCKLGHLEFARAVLSRAAGEAAHDWIRAALRLPDNAPRRFDFYAQEIERLAKVTRGDRKSVV